MREVELDQRQPKRHRLAEGQSESPKRNFKSCVKELQYKSMRPNVASNQLDRFGRVAFNKQLNLSQASLIVSSNGKSSNNSSEMLRFNSGRRKNVQPIGIFTDKVQRFQAFEVRRKQ